LTEVCAALKVEDSKRIQKFVSVNGNQTGVR
jgi:hypothetical protein